MRELRGAENAKDWKLLLPVRETLDGKDRDALEDIWSKRFLPPGRAERYLRVLLAYLEVYGARLDAGIWGAINFNRSFDIFSRLDALFAPLQLPISWARSFEESGTPWKLPELSGIDLHHLDNDAVAASWKILRPARKKASKALTALEERRAQHEALGAARSPGLPPELCPSAVALLLRYHLLRARFGHELDLAALCSRFPAPEEGTREALEREALGEIASLPRGQFDEAPAVEQLRELVFAAEGVCGWLEAAASAKYGIVYLIQ